MITQTWSTSSFSNQAGGNCIECREDQSRILIRDTQHRHLGHLDIPAAEWRAFLAGLRRGELG